MDPAPRPRDRSVSALIALGSNLGDREAHLSAAIAALRRLTGVEVVALSSVYETDPVGSAPQPAYLNAAARLETCLAPRELLACLLGIERTEGRTRGAQRGTARTLDLDLLLYGQQRIAESGLVVPHPRLHERAFVLEPLREIAGDWVHPLLEKTVEELARAIRDPGGVRPYRLREASAWRASPPAIPRREGAPP